ncbi:MAG: AraC family transcriptional regulator [Ferruginibacter sp.]
MKVVQFTIPVSTNNSIHVQEDRLPHFYEHLHRHNETQITWVVKGEGTLIAGSYMQPFSPGDIYIVGANQPHLFKSNPEYFEKESTKSVHSLNIFFDPKGFLTELLDFPEMLSIKKFIDISMNGIQSSPLNQKSIYDYIQKVNNSSLGFKLAAFIEMLQAFANFKSWKYLSAESFEYTTDSEGLRMDEIYQYTIAHYTEDITLEEISAVVFLTPQSFCRYFKKHTLKTYTTFLNEVRINEACKLFMANNFINIASVAYETGFNNVVNFNRVFKNIIGKTPGEFIKDYNKKIEIAG